MEEYVVVLENVTKIYKEGEKEEVEVFRDINIAFPVKKIIAIVGESGSGKTTLLNLIGGIDNPTQGKVIVKNVIINELPEQVLSDFRNKEIGFIYQYHFLLRGFTVLENIVMPLLIRGEKIDKGRIDYLMEFLGIAHLKDRYPEEISGGERQRVAIIRALAGNPSLILADEPTGNLDPKNARKVAELFLALVKEENKTAIVATHNIDIAKMADIIINLEDIKLKGGLSL